MFEIKNSYTKKVIGSVDTIEEARKLIQDTDHFIHPTHEELDLINKEIKTNA